MPPYRGFGVQGEGRGKSIGYAFPGRRSLGVFVQAKITTNAGGLPTGPIQHREVKINALVPGTWLQSGGNHGMSTTTNGREGQQGSSGKVQNARQLRYYSTEVDRKSCGGFGSEAGEGYVPCLAARNRWRRGCQGRGGRRSGVERQPDMKLCRPQITLPLAAWSPILGRQRCESPWLFPTRLRNRFPRVSGLHQQRSGQQCQAGVLGGGCGARLERSLQGPPKWTG